MSNENDAGQLPLSEPAPPPLMDKMLLMMIKLDANRGAAKIETSGLTDGEMKAIFESLKPVPEDTAAQINAFRADIGDETFKMLAETASLMPAVKAWLETQGERNFTDLYAKMQERVPDLTADEMRAIIYLHQQGIE